MKRNSLGLAIAFAGAVTLTALASGTGKYEVWAIDQSNSPGRTFGGTLYIWDGHDLENKHGAPTAVPDKIDLGGAAAALCLASTGANPVRPHMIAVNPSQTPADPHVSTGSVSGFGRTSCRSPSDKFEVSSQRGVVLLRGERPAPHGGKSASAHTLRSRRE